MTWISIKDRLPEVGNDVSLRHEYSHTVFKGFINERGQWFIYHKGHPVYQPVGITHWMHRGDSRTKSAGVSSAYIKTGMINATPSKDLPQIAITTPEDIQKVVKALESELMTALKFNRLITIKTNHHEQDIEVEHGPTFTGRVSDEIVINID